jgi:hypothetical protein
MQLSDIERLTKDYADSYDTLAGVVTDLNQQIEQLKRERLQTIRRAVRSSAERKAKLVEAISGAPDLFVKPRTYVFHGIKVGMMKEKGMLSWESEIDVVRLIRKHFADRFDELVRTTERPSKTALNAMPASDLRKLGVESVEAQDQVVVMPADSNVDKLVTALLKDAETIAISEHQEAA